MFSNKLGNFLTRFFVFYHIMFLKKRKRGFEIFVGIKGGKKENKLGMRASETAELIFENCRVHKSQILGNVGDGFVQAMKVLDGGRISIAALSLGIAKVAYEAALKYDK